MWHPTQKLRHSNTIQWLASNSWLYTWISNDDGIQACYEAWLLQEKSDPQHPPSTTLRSLLELVLKLNTLEFNERHYLQTLGTAMGSSLAPTYANTFMGKLKKQILNTARCKPKCYKCIIDNILWFLNSHNVSLTTLTHTWPIYTVHLRKELDLSHISGPERRITPTYSAGHIKPAAKQLYIKHDSHHPPGTFKGVTIDETIRLERANSKTTDFHMTQMLQDVFHYQKINVIVNDLPF